MNHSVEGLYPFLMKKGAFLRHNEQILSFIDEIHAKSLENYIARELSVVKGDSLHVEQLLNGWYWVRNVTDQTGWVPQENIELIV